MPGTTVGEIVGHRALLGPDNPAIGAIAGRAMTYAELARLMDERAADLASSRLSAPDRVAIVLPNGPHLATAFLSVTNIATAAPLNPALTSAEFEFYLGDLDARALIVAADDDSPSIAAAIRLDIPIVRLVADSDGPAGAFAFDLASGDLGQRQPPTPDTIALALHTSGTTARPKIVPLSHENLSTSARNVAATLQLTTEDTCLNVMPLFHIHGLVAALLATLSRGGKMICTPGFRAPPFFGWVEAHEATWYTAVPTMHQAIVARAKSEPSPLGSNTLRFARSSSASLAPSIIADLETALRVPVIEAYGMTEAAHQMASNPLGAGVRKPGSVGPAAGPELAIADAEGTVLEQGTIGEVIIRGRNVTAGYHGVDDRSPHFHEGGWFRTGDQGYLDADGYLFLTGRLKEIINRGGETIAPREIDEAMLALDGVQQAVAFAVPDSALGEEVAAAVVLEDGADVTEGALKTQLSEVLSLAKVPKRIVFVAEVPKGPTGKLQRIGLADQLGVASVRSAVADTRPVHADTIETITAIWMAVLEVDSVGPDDPFLESGGDSITVTALAVAIEEEFDIDLPLLAFYDAATIRHQAVLIEELLHTRA